LALLVLIPVQLTLVATNEWFAEPPKPVGDGPDYENIAYHLWQGKGFRFDNVDPGWRNLYDNDSYRYEAQLTAPPREMAATGRPPLLPSLIAFCYQLLGRNESSFAAIRCMLACCLAGAGAMAVHNACWFFRQTKPSAGYPTLVAASLAAGVTAFAMGLNGTLQDYATDFLTEPLALLLVQSFVTFLLLHAASELATQNQGRPNLASRYGWLVTSGICFGFAILARSIFVVWLPGLWCLLTITLPGKLRQRGRQATLVVFCASIVCFPWWIRNCVVLRTFAPLGTQGPITLLGGYSDAALQADGEWQPEPERALRDALASDARVIEAADDTQRELITSRIATEQVRLWLRSHVRELPSLFWGRTITHWNPYFGRALLWKLSALLGALAVLLSYLRLTLHPRKHKSDSQRLGATKLFAGLILGLPLLGTMVTAILYSVGGRFLVPMYGIISTLAGVGVASTIVRVLVFAGKTAKTGQESHLSDDE
jgi:hypothetical protein